jgi:putative YphP/YqiW family bacilliredoxin
MFDIKIRHPMYDPDAVQPMRDELVYVGFEELTTSQLVEEKLSVKDDKIKFVVINSVCGCAAGSARPGATLALQNKTIPDNFYTIFAGQDREAVDYVRQKYLNEFPPSSPSMAIIKNGEVIFMLPRHHIEGRTAEEISAVLTKEFGKNCKREGPSISEEAYAKLVHAKACGSRISLNENK